MGRQRRTIGATLLIVLMLAGLGLYSFRMGYRVGGDLARQDHRN